MNHTIISNKFIDVCSNIITWYYNTIIGTNWRIVSVVTVKFENSWITTITYM